jgi:hypothetical protein
VQHAEIVALRDEVNRRLRAATRQAQVLGELRDRIDHPLAAGDVAANRERVTLARATATRGPTPAHQHAAAQGSVRARRARGLVDHSRPF